MKTVVKISLPGVEEDLSKIERPEVERRVLGRGLKLRFGLPALYFVILGLQYYETTSLMRPWLHRSMF